MCVRARVHACVIWKKILRLGMWIGEKRGLGETQREAQLEENRKLSPGFAAGGGPLDACQCLDFPIPGPLPSSHW